MLSVTTNCTVFNMLVMLKYISFHFRASLCYTYTILFFLMTSHIFKLLLFAMFGQGNNCIAWVKPRFETAISFYKIFIKTLKKIFRKVSSPTKNPTCFVFSHKTYIYQSYLFDTTPWIYLSVALNMMLFFSDLVKSSYNGMLSVIWSSCSKNTITFTEFPAGIFFINVWCSLFCFVQMQFLSFCFFYCLY